VTKRTKYVQVYDGEWIQPSPMRGHKTQCCGCGLVHVVDYRVDEGRVQFRARVDRRATAAVRRKFNFTKDE
jgi:hypothetical protein